MIDLERCSENIFLKIERLSWINTYQLYKFRFWLYVGKHL